MAVMAVMAVVAGMAVMAAMVVMGMTREKLAEGMFRGRVPNGKAAKRTGIIDRMSIKGCTRELPSFDPLPFPPYVRVRRSRADERFSFLFTLLFTFFSPAIGEAFLTTDIGMGESEATP